MNPTVLSLAQLKAIFYGLIMGFLTNPAPDAVRFAWQTTGAPGFKITDDVVFVRLTPMPDAYSRAFQEDWAPDDSANVQVTQTYTRVIQADFNIYGPNSFDNADVIRAALFTSATKETLAASNLYLITDVENPVRTPELFNKQWWERSDFRARFNELVQRPEAVPAIASAAVTVMGQQ